MNMINFDDIRRTTEQTFVLFPDDRIDELTHFLTLAGVLDEKCKILMYDDAKTTDFGKTHNLSVPIDPRFANIPTAVCRTPCLIVSDMNEDDLRRKIQEIHESDECRLWKQDRMAALNAARPKSAPR